MCVCVCIMWHITYCNGWLNGLKLEEDFASFFWTHSPYLILGHPQKQFTSQHRESGHSAAHEKEHEYPASCDTSLTAQESHSCPFVHYFTHILEKPLYSSQALTSADVEAMSRVTGPLVSRCEGEQRE